MKNIMVPIDFSENSILALETAIVLANKLEADLRMIHVTPSDANLEYAKGLENHKNADEFPQDKLDKLASQYSSQYTGKGKFDYKILSGNVAEELVNVAKYDQVSMIVTGSHGVSGFTEKWIGSNALKLICNATCPVLVIRPNMTFNKSFSHFLAPIHIKKSSRRMIPTVANIAQLFSSKIILVGIQTSSLMWIFNRISAAVKQVQNYLSRKGVEVESTTMLKGKDSYEKLFDIAKEKKADMIVCDVSNTGSFLSDRFRTELNKIINSSPCPVLTVPIAYK